MAIYNEIQVGRVNRFLQKFLAIKGGPPSPQLQADVGATIDIRLGVETRYLEGWDRFGAVPFAIAGAANKSACRIRNPKNSGILLVVERVMFWATTTAISDQPFVTRDGDTDLTSIFAVSNANLDLRGRPSPGAVLSFQSTTPAGLGTGIWQGAFVAGSQVELINTDNQELCLTPGSSLTGTGNVLNQQVNMTLLWRERAIEDAEKF